MLLTSELPPDATYPATKFIPAAALPIIRVDNEAVEKSDEEAIEKMADEPYSGSIGGEGSGTICCCCHCAGRVSDGGSVYRPESRVALPPLLMHLISTISQLCRGCPLYSITIEGSQSLYVVSGASRAVDY